MCVKFSLVILSGSKVMSQTSNLVEHLTLIFFLDLEAEAIKSVRDMPSSDYAYVYQVS